MPQLLSAKIVEDVAMGVGVGNGVEVAVAEGPGDGVDVADGEGLGVAVKVFVGKDKVGRLVAVTF